MMPQLALFDFDGTITHQEMFTPFLRYAVLPRQAKRGKYLLAPYIVLFRLGFISTSRMRQIVVKTAFKNRLAKDIREAGRRFSAQLSGVVRPEMLERVNWHKQRGDTVVVVSASLDVYLQPWCDGHQIDLVCTQLEIDGEHLTGRYLDGDCSGAGKVRKLLERYDLKQFSLVYAYGDTEEDHALLNIADRRFYQGKDVSVQF